MTKGGPERPPDILALRPGLALLSVIALFSLSLEVELLLQIDSLRLYLTTGEIALEAGFALLFSIGIAISWWLLALLVGQIVGIALPTQASRIHLQWDLWVAPPLAYLMLDLFQDLKLEILPHWHAGMNIQVLVGLAVLGLCIAAFFGVGWPRLNRFFRTRLVPIAWFHIAIGVVAAIALWMHGVKYFRDYERPMHATTTANLPDIYLITIDALRAEDMSLYGYSRPTTPNLEKFAQRSFVFDYCFANSNFTTPATVSIETGKLPWSHGVYQGAGFLRNQNQRENLPALLQGRGYYTAMITSNFLAAPFRHRTLESYDAVQYAAPSGSTGLRFRLSNFEHVNSQATLALSLLRGVVLLTAYLDRVFLGDRYPYPAEDVFGRETRLLESLNNSQPIFVWSHIFPPHDPYWPPPAYRHRFVSEQVQKYDKLDLPDPQQPRSGITVQQLHDSYDEMILYADHSVGEFLDWMDRTGRLDRSIVIVSSDHGELFDHDRVSHGGRSLYNGVIHIPLLIHLPGQQHGVRVEQLAQQIDLLPTLLDLASSLPPNWAQGTSLKPAFEGKSLPDHYVFSMNFEPNRIFDPLTKGTVAVMDNDFKLVQSLDTGNEELYRYKTDPGEQHNLLDAESEAASRLRSVLLQKLNEVNHQLSHKE